MNAEVLLVEDNRINQIVTNQILTRAGISADTASSAEEALAALAEHRYGVVLMDVQMPGMDGIAATRVIRDPHSEVLDHNVPVIAMTAYTSEDDRRAFAEAGMTDYVSKPLEVDRLLEVVRAHLPSHRAHLPSHAENSPKQTESPGRAEPPRRTAAPGHTNRPQPAQQPSRPPLDTAELRLRCNNSEALVQELLTRFQSDLGARHAALRQALASGERRRIAETAHVIAGAAGNVSAPRLRELTLEMENHARNGDVAAAGRLQQAVDEEIELVQGAIEDSAQDL